LFATDELEIEPAEYFENPVVTRTGEERLIAWQNTIIRGDDGQISTTLSSGKDITEQRQAEAQVEHYRVHLETLVSEHTAQLEEANEKLWQKVAIEEMIRQAVELLKPKAKRQAVQIHVRCDQQLPVLRGDAIQLEQVIVNLLSNAIESLDGRQDETRKVEVIATETPDQHIEISVHDNGPGMDKEMPRRIFDAFMTTKPNGMGMGLFISRSIVEAHGGNMWVDSETRSGATIRIVLPVKHKARQ